ncbi:MAG TPA: PPK2 family polyphosphate kinase [Gemmatimonadales bacterium]|nr:PPK2 family polyphosphate kinase [Gemmatimonadales bacterium]
MSWKPEPLAPIGSGTPIALTDAAASPPKGMPGRGELDRYLADAGQRLDALQTALYAEASRALLVVLQGRDASGKDGTIRRVFGVLNPQGFSISSFKAPTPLELAHDFLWRAHLAVPAKGAIGVFNRSHYEDVLVVRVRQLVPESVWRPRYEQINQFERILTQNGVTILKFLLHISREEQRDRLLARLDDPAKHWKFSAGDLDDRNRWDQFNEAFEEMLQRTSTAEAPWFLVPADKQHVRDVLVAATVLQTLERMNPQYPGPPADLAALRRALG